MVLFFHSELLKGCFNGGIITLQGAINTAPGLDAHLLADHAHEHDVSRLGRGCESVGVPGGAVG